MDVFLLEVVMLGWTTGDKICHPRADNPKFDPNNWTRFAELQQGQIDWGEVFCSEANFGFHPINLQANEKDLVLRNAWVPDLWSFRFIRGLKTLIDHNSTFR